MQRVLRVFLVCGVLLIAAPIPSVAQVSRLTLKTNYPFVVTQAGKNVTFGIQVLTPSPSRVDLAVEGLPAGWQSTLRGGGFVVGGVFGDDEAPPQLDLEVQVPAATPPGDFNVSLVGRSGSATNRLVLTLRVSEQASGAIALTSEFPDQRAESSATFTFRASLENNTPEKASFSMTASGPEGWAVAAQPATETTAATLAVDGGGSAEIQVTADPPDNATSGKYPINLEVTGPEGEKAAIELNAEVSGSTNFVFTTNDERLNRDGRAGRATRIELVVRNEGTSALQNVTVNATPPTGWEVENDPESIEAIPPGETGTINLIVTPASDALAGDYNLSVNATNAGGGSESFDLRFTVKTSRLFGLVGLLIIAAAAWGLYSVYKKYGRR